MSSNARVLRYSRRIISRLKAARDKGGTSLNVRVELLLKKKKKKKEQKRSFRFLVLFTTVLRCAVQDRFDCDFR